MFGVWVDCGSREGRQEACKFGGGGAVGRPVRGGAVGRDPAGVGGVVSDNSPIIVTCLLPVGRGLEILLLLLARQAQSRGLKDSQVIREGEGLRRVGVS